MKKLLLPICLMFGYVFMQCQNDDDSSQEKTCEQTASTGFAFQSQVILGANESAAEISAYDKETKQIFTTDADTNAVQVIDITDVANPVKKSPIALTGGGVNSVAVANGYLAIAEEGASKQDAGKITIYKTADLTTVYHTAVAGALPDMVTFTPDGNYILAANEGEPNDDYTNDPEGTVTIVDVQAKTESQVDFTAFNSKEAELEADGFRVFGPNADLAKDVEPEYIAVSSDSKTAFVVLQENNGVAKLDIASKTITDIFPLGLQDFSKVKMDASNKDDKEGNFQNWPVKSFFMPDAIASLEVGGVDYYFIANEGDAREYEGTPGFVEEDRVADLMLDPTAFPDAATMQLDENLGRLKTTYTPFAPEKLGDDETVSEIYGFGGRSFSVLYDNGTMVYDSGSELEERTLTGAVNGFNQGDGRSDDKGPEPEGIATLTACNGAKLVFVGLERTGGVMVYNVDNPLIPQFVQYLNEGEGKNDTSPEGLLTIPAADSPNGKDLLVVSNEYPNGYINIYSQK